MKTLESRVVGIAGECCFEVFGNLEYEYVLIFYERSSTLYFFLRLSCLSINYVLRNDLVTPMIFCMHYILFQLLLLLFLVVLCSQE